MIYEAYQEKVTKVANFLKKIFKHIALIIGTLSVAVLLLISFLATKGMMLGEFEVDTTVTYGEGISVNAKALFSKVEYEYSRYGEDDWSTDVPTLVGKYEVRAKSKASFGQNRYTESVELSIVPKKIDVHIVESGIVYGEYPTVSAILVGKDRIECEEYIFEDPTATTTNVEAKYESVKIYNAKDKDVTSCYDINIVPSELKISQRPLEITVSSQTMVYNGTTLAFDGYEISGGSLGFADKLGAEFDASITDVGSVINTPDLIVRNGDGDDVTHLYKIKIRSGTLTVTQRPIVVVTPSDDKIYDGEALQNGNVDIHYGDDGDPDPEVITLGGTVEKVTEPIEPETTKEYESLDVEPLPPDVQDAITDESLDDHYFKEYFTEWSEEESSYVERLNVIKYTEHFDLDHDERCDFCNTEIDAVNHEYIDNNFDYNCDTCVNIILINGEVIDLEDIMLYGVASEDTPASKGEQGTDVEEIGVIEGHKVIFGESPSITNIGYITNAISVQGIYDSEGNDKTSNYSIFYDFGTLTVHPRKVTITTPTEEWIYDGETHSTNYTLVGDGIAPNQKLDITMPTILNVGSIDNTAIFDIVDANGNSVIYNYEITTDFGTLTIQKRKLTVTTESGEWVYDGYAHTTPVILGGDNIAPGQSYKASGKEIITVGEIQNTVTIEIFDKYGISSIENYEITTSFGILKVTPRVIQIGSSSYDKIYDGGEHYFDKPIVTTEFEYTPIAENQQIVVTSYPTVKDYTEVAVENKLEYYIADEYGNDVTSNYQITEAWGTLNIQKRPFKYYTESYDEAYDGQMHEFGIVIEDEQNVFEGMVFTPYVMYSTVTLEDYTPEPIINNIEVTIYDSYSDTANDISYNFDIECTFVGTLNISKRQIILKTESGSWVYDGYVHSLETPILSTPDGCNYEPIAPAQSLIVTKYPTVKNYTETPIENKLEYHIENIAGRDVTYNYEITDIEENRGTLEITKRPLYYHTEDYDAAYDGIERTFGIIIENEDAFYDGMAFVPTIDYTSIKIKDAMAAPIANSYVINIYNPNPEVGEDANITSNFDIQCTYEGTLFVQHRKIEIKTESDSWIYDGYEHSLPNPTITSRESYTPIAPNQSFTVISYPTVKNWTNGKVQNKLEYYIDDGYGNDVTYNYEIVDKDMGWGTLEIIQRKLSVKTYGGIWTFDGQWHGDSRLEFGIDGIAPADRYEVTYIPSVKNYTATPVENKIEFTIFAPDGEDSIGKYNNYDIEDSDYGDLVIDPLHIYLVSNDIELTYDSYNHAPALNAYISGSGEYLFSTGYESYTDSYVTYPASYGDSLVITEYSLYKNHTDGNFVYAPVGFAIYDSEGNDSINELGNYVIDRVSYANIKIDKRQLNYRIPTNLDLVYNGKMQSDTNIIFSQYDDNDYSTIADLDKLIINSATEIIDYENGKLYENVIDFTIVDKDGIDMGDNYELHLIGEGYLCMNRRPVYINTNSHVWEYDEEEHYDDGFKVNMSYPDSYNLVSGEKLTFATHTIIKDMGSVPNSLSDATVYSNSREMDVTFNYVITVNDSDRGTLKIVPKKLSVKPIDVNKVYDGEYITVTDWEYAEVSNQLLDGHYVYYVTYEDNSYVDAGTYYSSISAFKIADEYGNDVTDMYEVVGLYGSEDVNYGIIVIEKLQIIIESSSKTKPFDGAPLTNESITVHYINGSPIEGHTISVDFTGTITEIGTAENSFENVVITDRYGNEVTYNYDFADSIIFGALQIIPCKVGEIYSTKTHYEYIKTGSFGDYISGTNFYSAPTYSGGGYYFNPETLVATAFRNKGYKLDKQIMISGIDADAYYGDTVYDGYYYSFPNDLFGNLSVLQGHLGELSSYEEEYRNWVYANYTGLDYKTFNFLQGVIAEQGFSIENPNIYDEVALFIQSSAKYGFGCANELDASSNVTISLLTNEYGNEALCRHYATAATMLYRALGIPARYTVGYLVETSAYEWVDITSPGHAWVEVYIDNLGWIPVEVTAGDENGFTMNNGKPVSGTVGGVNYGKPQKIQLHIKPEDITFEYSGDELYHSGIIQNSNCYCGIESETLINLYNMGYNIQANVYHERIVDAGTYMVYIDDVHVYYNGEDVTYKFDIVTHDGYVYVNKVTIDISFGDVETVFDGNMVYPSNEIISGRNEIDRWIEKGYSFEYVFDIDGNPGAVNVGVYYANVNVIVYNRYYEDVTYNFNIYAYSGRLEINPFDIQVYLYQNHKMYDGAPLTYASAFNGGSYYRVMNTLPDGFEFYLDVTIELTDVTAITVDDFNYNSYYYNFWVTDNYYYDMTSNFTLTFVKLSYGDVEIDYIPMQITPRQITVTTASQSKVYDGNVLENSSYVIGGAGAANGENIEAEVVGKCYDIGWPVENSVDGIYITDMYGNREFYWVYPYNGEVIVIGNYEITFIYGILEIT